MKYIKRFIAVLLIAVIAVSITNAKTDLFLNFGEYFPSFNEKHPEAVSSIIKISENMSLITDRIPSPSEIWAAIRHEEPPIDPTDIAVNAYIENSPMLTFYPGENIGIIVDFNTVEIFGITASKQKSHLVAEFSDENNENLEQVSFAANSSGEFNKKISIPDSDSETMKLAVYTGSKSYGQFTSWVYNYITLDKTPDGGWEMSPSPVFEHNKQMYEKDKSVKEALKHTPSIQSNSAGIISIAEQLTNGLESDYDKALALHDWICSYMYYDIDSISSEETPPYFASDIVKSQRAVCLGFATLMAALCRSVGIPCNVVSGYALGVSSDTSWTEETVLTDDQNHAWNEVYVDGRWIIVDTTWDCANKIENGELIKKDTEVSHIYFDANLQFFSNNHKILEYSKRR